MKKIFVGPINTLHLKSLLINKSNIELVEKSTVLKKDALFYQNKFGKMINLEYNTCLPTKEEAEDYFSNINLEKEQIVNVEECSIVYCDEEELKYLKSISNKEFRQLKKKMHN